MTIGKVFEKFILVKESQGKSFKTVLSYRNNLHVFFKFFSSDTDISELSEDIVLKYCAYVYRHYNSKATAASYLTHLRSFIHWCNDNKYITAFQYTIIYIKKPKKRRVNYLTDNQVRILFDNITSSIPWIAERDKAIVGFCYDSGPRLSEILNIRLKDINFENNTLFVYGKGEKSRLIPFGNYIADFIKSYINLCPFDINDRLFVNRNNKPLTEKAVQTILNRLKHKTGFDISCHKLRHNFSEIFLEDNYRRTGASNINELQVLLGHSDLKTTMIYQNIFTEKLACEHYSSHLDSIYKSDK